MDVMSDENPYTAPAADPQISSEQGGAPGPHNYASLGERFLGALIDGLIMIPVSLVLVLIVGLMFTPVAVAEPSFLDTLQGGAGFGIAGGLVLSLLGIAAYIAIQWTFWKGSSQSIGKKVMKTQIVNLDGTRADVNTIAFNRYAVMGLLSAIPVVGGIIGLVNALLVFRGDRNCLHDDIAKTRVIKLSAPPVQ